MQTVVWTKNENVWGENEKCAPVQRADNSLSVVFGVSRSELHLHSYLLSKRGILGEKTRLIL